MAWTSPVIPQIQITNSTSANLTSQEEPSIALTETQCGMVGSMLAFGALLSSVPSGYLADRFGRKKIILSLAVPFIISWLVIVLAKGATLLYIGRFFAGFAIGATCVCAPMYVGEISDPSIRGKLGSFFQMFICTGILLSYAIGAIVPWKILSMILVIFPVLFAVCFFTMPETPVYLVKIDDIEGARRSLRYFRGKSYDVQREIDELKAEVKQSQSKKGGVRDLIATPANKRALMASLGVMVFQQLSGINAVIFYTVPIFKAAGSSLSPSLATIMVGVLQLIIAYIAAMLMERANRRFFLKLSSIGMMICLASLGMYFHYMQSTNINEASTLIKLLPIMSMLLYMVFFSFGFGPIPWMVISELFAPEIKGPAAGLAVMTNWILVFAVTFAFPILNSTFGGHVTFYLFALLMAIGTVFVHYMLPETRGKTLQEIQAILSKM